MKAKTVGNTQYIDVDCEQGRLLQTVATVTITGPDGRKARAWVIVKIDSHGKAVFGLATLGASAKSDRTARLTAAWHNDLT